MPRAKLSNVSLSQLVGELKKRQSKLADMIAQRDALSREITELQGLAAPEAGKAAKPEAVPKKTRRHRRAKNKVGLADALAGFLKGKKKVAIGEAMEGVLAAGYKTTSKEFRKVVNKTLLTDKRFKKIGRGVFTLKV